jgi:hypothetical protein
MLVEEPTEFGLIIDLKTAEELDLALPRNLRVNAGAKMHRLAGAKIHQ